MSILTRPSYQLTWCYISPDMLPSIKLVAIDDTPASLELISESLQQEGLTIFTATDPEEGLDLVFQEHPQIVLLDLVMPKLSGLDAVSYTHLTLPTNREV